MLLNGEHWSLAVDRLDRVIFLLVMHRHEEADGDGDRHAGPLPSSACADSSLALGSAVQATQPKFALAGPGTVTIPMTSASAAQLRRAPRH